MAKYLKSKCKMSRRVCLDLSLKSIAGRNISSKCNLKTYPGQHGAKKRKPPSNYSIQLSAKQTIKFTYGILEKQFYNIYKNIMKKNGSKGELLLKSLESRLDNVVYRMGFAITRAEARQLVTHKTVIVKRNNNEKIISIPSYIVKPKDIVKIKYLNKKQSRIQHALMCAEKIGFPAWLNIDLENLAGEFIRYPNRNELSTDFQEQSVIEFYSK